MPEPDLRFIVESQVSILNRLETLRDDHLVTSATVRRIDDRMGHLDQLLQDILDELRAIHRQHARFDYRLRQLEKTEDQQPSGDTSAR